MRQKPGSPLQLPQTVDTWFVCLREISLQLSGAAVIPTVLLLLDLTREELLGFDVYETRPDAEVVRQQLWKLMLQPQMGYKTPHRPQEIKFEQADLMREIIPSLGEIHVATSLDKAPPLVDALIYGLIQTLDNPPTELPGLLSVPGTDPKMIACLFDAAAFFYQAAPWKRIIDYQTMAVTIDPPGQQLFVQVMGNGGMEFGLTLYTAWEDVLRIFEHADSPLDFLPESGMHGLTFGTKDDLPAEDRSAMRKYGWKTAGRMACPLPVTFTKDGGAERPSRQELLFYEALLRGLPTFIERNLVEDSEDDFEPVEAVIESQNFDGPVRMTIRYPAGEMPDWEEDLSWAEDDLDTLNLPAELLEANQLADQAWEEGDPKEQMRLALEALEISSDCTEAYLVLAFGTEAPEEAQELLEKAVQAGERALGQEFIEENEGFLWDYHEARPYLRALDGLAENLEALGREDEALAQYLRLLILNEEDHQGARYNALRLQLHLKHDEQARDLIDEFEEGDSATWAYSRALLAFRESGDITRSRKELKIAIRTNPYIPAYLTGTKPLPAEAPQAIGFGDESEAIQYVLDHYPNWWGTPGAVDWLKKHSKPGATRNSKKRF
jgi:tetratricopeptide (TPR) repeat protein